MGSFQQHFKVEHCIRRRAKHLENFYRGDQARPSNDLKFQQAKLQVFCPRGVIIDLFFWLFFFYSYFVKRYHHLHPQAGGWNLPHPRQERPVERGEHGHSHCAPSLQKCRFLSSRRSTSWLKLLSTHTTRCCHSPHAIYLVKPLVKREIYGGTEERKETHISVPVDLPIETIRSPICLFLVLKIKKLKKNVKKRRIISINVILHILCFFVHIYYNDSIASLMDLLQNVAATCVLLLLFTVTSLWLSSLIYLCSYLENKAEGKPLRTFPFLPPPSLSGELLSGM